MPRKRWHVEFDVEQWRTRVWGDPGGRAPADWHVLEIEDYYIHVPPGALITELAPVIEEGYYFDMLGNNLYRYSAGEWTAWRRIQQGWERYARASADGLAYLGPLNGEF